jgi:phage-related protein
VIAGLPTSEKPIEFIASAEDDLAAMPKHVKRVFGFAIYMAQVGLKHENAKPLKSVKGAGVLEVVEDYDGDTYRAIYTVKFRGIVYVLDAFQKKSKRGISTPTMISRRIETRLKLAQEDYRKRFGKAG